MLVLILKDEVTGLYKAFPEQGAYYDSSEGETLKAFKERVAKAIDLRYMDSCEFIQSKKSPDDLPDATFKRKEEKVPTPPPPRPKKVEYTETPPENAGNKMPWPEALRLREKYKSNVGKIVTFKKFRSEEIITARIFGIVIDKRTPEVYYRVRDKNRKVIHKKVTSTDLTFS